ncbi:cyanophycinase [Mangrovivirga sp. M17]|uniref:Cyanophycinase n=1 Tax=Mangrovivirga halotolerans TaxID=2993936 RepID=A0ABT3RNV5_9BACT|nr:cyanophycinase [Mangrovivirga halotolerans]MCX2743483.1 cyanophycinase [Mangrovivirga halotolerans]
MKYIYLILSCFVFYACTEGNNQNNTEFDERDSADTTQVNLNKGSLIIIGGGSRPEEMIKRIVTESGIDTTGYGMILPMSSIEPDSSNWYAKKQFSDLGYENIYGVEYDSVSGYRETQIDSLSNASLIYISGGDQRRFMQRIAGTRIGNIIRDRYAEGAVIAGTSAGAAVQSRRMITGDERKYPEYHTTYRHLEEENFDWTEGLALIDGVIIDQHFVKRSRYNRLLTAIMTFPDEIGVGIDESTAIIVKGDSAEVIGESQVITFENSNQNVNRKNGKLGTKGIILDIYLPGDNFYLKQK